MPPASAEPFIAPLLDERYDGLVLLKGKFRPATAVSIVGGRDLAGRLAQLHHLDGIPNGFDGRALPHHVDDVQAYGPQGEILFLSQAISLRHPAFRLRPVAAPAHLYPSTLSTYPPAAGEGI